MTRVLAPLSAVLIGLAGCGGGSDSAATRSATIPVTAGERDAAAQLKYCFEGAGALTAKPGKPVPGVGDTPAAPGVKDANHILVVAWTDTKHVANVYYARSDAAAASAGGELTGKPVKQKGKVVVAADEKTPPSADEALLVSDCLP